MKLAFRRFPFLLSSVLGVVLAGGVVAAVPVEETFHFARIDGTYSNPDPVIAPIEQGGLTVQLRSPANRVQLFDHELQLRPLGDGTHGAWLKAVIGGQGDLEADLSIGGAPATHLTDEVEIPRQVLKVFGQIRLERVADGYLVTAVELQPRVELKIQSRLASSLAGTCRGFTRLLPLGIDCGGLESALAQAAVPMPAAGETFLLPDRLLTDADRHQLDAYLGIGPAR
ncbi:MAG: hypothetical protein KDD11_16900 [Acidobacteria bacterium]|nr:hypothetical protein [Acidobacteriota bacterium]